MVTILLVAAFATGALAIFGIQEQNMNFIAIGLGFGFFLLLGLALNRGESLTGPGTFSQAAFGYWVAHLPFLVSVPIGGGLSLFSAPTNSHLSIVQQAAEYIQIKVNLWMATIIETVTFLGVIAVLFIAIKRGTRLGVYGSLSIALSLGGTAFALLHGARTLLFFAFAFLSVTVWAVLVFGHDLGWWETSKMVIGLSVAIGLHKGNNHADLQIGVVESWQRILAAPEPIVYISWAIVLFEVVTLAAAAWFVVSWAVPWIKPAVEKARG
ncbi:hypothetical protein HT576_08770 [Haloterrigena sp. SYSU A121-1]|uniref:Uncharacterized protein n=1 Tax=Haloterrigena gelatinilytica TaxID=2741724 RepID=A0A8J8GNL0_9EURY|nr:hypothetical protein [Haloterrigena gelatinilytica]NUB91112.1 hypothetical protein [Haloterrigena gelatinilytica]